MAATGGFVGRQPEIDALCAALDQVCAGSGRLAMLAGSPGIGKTSTALELAAHATRRDALVWWGRCHEEAGAPPYWPWVQVIRAAIAELDPDALRHDCDAGAADIAEIVPELHRALPGLDAPAPLQDASARRFRLFGSVARFLGNVARRRPLVLVLDDLHWADVPSLRLLEFLAHEIGSSRVLALGTYRDTDLSRRHRLSDTLGALARVPHLLRLHLAGLNADEVRRFVALAAGMVPPGWLAAAIHQQTEGNPLFVREVVRFLQQQGQLTGDGAAIAPPLAIRLPEGVREVIGRRLNLLSTACNEILAVAAVIGREFALDVLLRANARQAEDAVLEALDEALSAQIIEETTPGRYQFTHTLVRITLYDELRTGRRRALHHAVGEAIEAVHRRDPKPVLADLAHHFQAAGLAGDAERAIDYAIRAGRSADAALAFEDAIALFQNALDILDTRGTDDPARRCDLLLALGEALRKTNDFPQSMQTLRAAADLARAHGMARAFAEAVIEHALSASRFDTVSLSGAPSGDLLEEALAGLPASEVGMRTKMTGLLGRDRLRAGATQQARQLVLEAIAMARTLGDPDVLATSLWGLLDFPWQPHETVQQLALADEIIAVAEPAGNGEFAMHGHFRRAAVCAELGDIDGAIASIEAMDRLNAHLRQPVYALFVLGLKAAVALMRGALDEAERLIARSLKLTGTAPHAHDQAATLTFSLRREQGRLRELAPLVTAFVRLNPAAATWRPGLALLYLEIGETPAARGIFDALAADDFAGLPRDGRWTTSLVFLAEVCAALGDAPRAAVLYRLLLPWAGLNIVAGAGTGCWGSCGRFLGMLATVLGHWPEAERHFADALAMDARTGALAPLAHTHFAYAAMKLARLYPGDAAGAAGHLAKAGELADRLGLAALAGKVADRLAGAPPPAPPDELTARELEVLQLLAIGRSNADIALVLAISQNTVATHVRNVLAKTGCANRTEAAAYAMRHGLQAVG